jgi:antitoxin HigA-1
MRAVMDRLKNVHPGEVLSEEFLVPMGLTPYRLAKSIGVPQTRVSGILKGRRSITSDTALRLARFFGTSAQFWLNLQADYDLEEAGRDLGSQLAGIRPWAEREPAVIAG